MAYAPPPRRRRNEVTAEAVLVLFILFFAFAAGIAGYAIGHSRAGDDNNEPAAAETTTEGTTTESATTAEATTEGTTTESGGGEAADGKAVFESAGCGACHTFTPAGSNGQVGPNLDNIDLSKQQIERQVRNGGGGMPAFGGRLSDQEISAVADFVESG